jgi:hypothetical protein
MLSMRPGYFDGQVAEQCLHANAEGLVVAVDVGPVRGLAARIRALFRLMPSARTGRDSSSGLNLVSTQSSMVQNRLARSGLQVQARRGREFHDEAQMRSAGLYVLLYEPGSDVPTHVGFWGYSGD